MGLGLGLGLECGLGLGLVRPEVRRTCGLGADGAALSHTLASDPEPGPDLGRGADLGAGADPAVTLPLAR